MTFLCNSHIIDIDPTTNMLVKYASFFTLINILVNNDFDQQFLNLFYYYFFMILLV